MAARLTAEDRLQRLVAKCRARLDSMEEPPNSLSNAPDSRLGRLARDAGYERVSAKFCEVLEARLWEVGVDTYPSITGPMNTRETRIHFFEAGRKPKGLQPSRVLFPTEKDLSDFIELNFAALSYMKKNALRLRGSQVRIAQSCRIDLLADDAKSKELVGFELKHAAADDRAVSQAARYMEALRKQAEKEGLPGARLLIVTGQPDPDLHVKVQELADARGVPTTWLTYRLSLELADAGKVSA